MRAQLHYIRWILFSVLSLKQGDSDLPQQHPLHSTLKQLLLPSELFMQVFVCLAATFPESFRLFQGHIEIYLNFSNLQEEKQEYVSLIRKECSQLDKPDDHSK